MPDRPQVCAVTTEDTVEAARAAMKRTPGIADLIELRLDYLRDFDFSNPNSLRVLLEEKPLPVIITCRAISEGGAQHVDEQTRISLLVEGAKRFADYCDIEAASYAEAARLAPDLSRLIVSYHNFDETPDDLNEIYARVTSLPAAIHKIVTGARTITDSLAIFKLLQRARDDAKPLIAMSMGQAGIITRVLAPSRGSFLTYGSIARGKESAAGQMTCEELIDKYRIRQLSSATCITAIIGSPVGHSASPAMHNRAFAELNLDLVYLPLEVEDVKQFIKRMVRPETREMDWTLQGLSVTIPHKTSIIPLLDDLDQTAREVGAANTVVIRDGKLIGYNTDAQAFLEPLARIHAVAGAKCAVLGAGGAARAVIHGLLQSGAKVSLFARNVDRSRVLAQSFGIDASPIESISSSDAAVIINTTPAGMRGHSEGTSPVTRAALRGRQIAYDLVYNPTETRFLTDARGEGCQTIGGLEMLVAQAALQFALWTGRSAPLDAMREEARRFLES
ncbi:MAG TPA: shikimate dehydrogenase [Blastocatellia bacterium]|nr:shikimate dehydrogenase [Blastocatellia bacterium]